MYRVALCEDDLTQKNLLKDYIKQIFSEVSSQLKLYEYSSGTDLINSNLVGIDIYFLDIKMSGLSGMETALKIREDDENSEIIFITSLIDYIQDGYIVRAYRYLSKPVKYEELKEHVLNCIEDIRKKKENFLIVENKGEIVKIPIEKILYIEVRKKELTIHTSSILYKTRSSMNKIEKDLKKYNFFRCHKSFLINLKEINYLNKDYVDIAGEIVPVSKHRINELKKLITYILGDVLC
jgi:DNA-binding LytR/AlgR family response regulator